MKHYALIGKQLDYSYSKKYFDNKFSLEKIAADYNLLSIPDLNNIKEFINQKKINGFNITIPFKEKIIPFADWIEPRAKKIAAVNCIVIAGKQWHAYNTDYLAIEKLIPSFTNNKKLPTLILGNGGASKSIQHFCREQQTDFLVVGRNKKKADLLYNEINEAILEKYKLIVQTTPLGTFPNIKDKVDFPLHHLNTSHFVFDLIYNPAQTTFLNLAANQGAKTMNGLSMLELQVEESYKIWTK